MSNGKLFLRPDIQVEPLSDGWYAWSHLISPATHARNLTERHIKIMDSYINAPQIHAAAVANPKMVGGPFIDYNGGRVAEIKALRDETWAKRKRMVELSQAFLELDDMLRSRAKGFSLTPLYEEMPNALRGFVELLYDRDNQPFYRICEPLLYRSRFYDPEAQHINLSVIENDDRPFILSTPRLTEDGRLNLSWKFNDRRLDFLFQLKVQPKSLVNIRDNLGFEDSQAGQFEKFLTDTPPDPYQVYEGRGVRWRYFGHACILVEARGVNILVDPVLSYTYESGLSRYTYADLPDHIDYVLITHNHQDHVLLETLLQIRHKIGTIVVPPNGCASLQDPSLRLALMAIGFNTVYELRELEELPFRGGSVVGIPFLGEHSDLAVYTKIAYLVRLDQATILFAADSCNVSPELYRHLHGVIGGVDVIFLGMECDGAPLSWLYGPLLTTKLQRQMDESRRLCGSNYEQAIALIEAIGCKQLYVYAMGQEPWLNYIMSIKYTEESKPIVESNRLLMECHSRGMVAERLFGEREIIIS